MVSRTSKVVVGTATFAVVGGCLGMVCAVKSGNPLALPIMMKTGVVVGGVFGFAWGVFSDDDADLKQTVYDAFNATTNMPRYVPMPTGHDGPGVYYAAYN